MKSVDRNAISYLILNETEAECLSGVRRADEFMEWMAERHKRLCVVLALGKKGVYTSAEGR